MLRYLICEILYLKKSSRKVSKLKFLGVLIRLRYVCLELDRIENFKNLKSGPTRPRRSEVLTKDSGLGPAESPAEPPGVKTPKNSAKGFTTQSRSQIL